MQVVGNVAKLGMKLKRSANKVATAPSPSCVGRVRQEGHDGEGAVATLAAGFPRCHAQLCDITKRFEVGAGLKDAV